MEVPDTRDSVSLGKLSLTGYPYIFYSPETEFAIGGALIFSMRTDVDPNTKASNAMLSGYYSEKGSYDLFLNPEVFLVGEKYYITASIDYYRFVDKFWGIGDNTPDIDSAGYVRNALWTNIEADVSIYGALKLGVNYDLNYTSAIDKQSNPYLLAGDLTGTEGGVSSGVGLVLFVDTRNNAFSPSEGGSYKLSMLNAAPYFGSKFTFTRWILDARHYTALSKSIVLALQVYGSIVAGTPPFYMFPALGGDNIMRGYYEGRYRDKIYWAAQAEFRVRLTNRWGFVAFAGAGDVSGRLSRLQAQGHQTLIRSGGPVHAGYRRTAQREGRLRPGTGHGRAVLQRKGGVLMRDHIMRSFVRCIVIACAITLGASGRSHAQGGDTERRSRRTLRSPWVSLPNPSRPDSEDMSTSTSKARNT